MAVLRSGSKCSHTPCMLRFFSTSRLAMNPNLNFEIGSIYHNPDRPVGTKCKSRFVRAKNF
jgi:hypothetical protein